MSDLSVQESQQSQEKLSLVTKLAYGVGDVGPALVSAIMGFYLNAFLLDVAGLRPALVGNIFLIVKLWDGVNDPLIGRLTDRTRTRWGRRRPWLLFGSIPFGLAWLLQWLVPELGQMGLFWYYLVVAILLDTAFTAVNVPYTAMTPELAKSYDERTNLNAYRFGFSIMGGLIALGLHDTIVNSAATNIAGYAISGAIMAAVIIISNVITFSFTRESDFPEEAEQDAGFIEGIKVAVQNRAFMLVVGIYLLAWFCVQFVQSNMLLYMRYYFGFEDRFIILAAALQVSAFIFVMIWSRVSQTWGKQRVYYAGMSFWILVAIALFFIPPGQFTLLVILAALAGVGTSIALLIPWSMLPDVIDLDELQTGERREGIYYGIFVFMQKLPIALGGFIANQVFELTGYITPTPDNPIPTQPEGVLLALRLFISFVPAVILLISFLLVRAYPITRERHAQIRRDLALKKAAAGD